MSGSHDTPWPPDRTLASDDPADRSTQRPFPTAGRPAGYEPLPDVPGYAVTGVIARGGMGVVYKAIQHGLNRPAAIKLLHGWGDVSPAAEMRFTIEAEAVARLDHPHVVGVYEFGQHRGAPFLAMEYVDGGTLAERLRRDGRLAPWAAAELLAKLADGVAAAHAKGIVHRDLKPSNVMLTAAGEPKVTDFGLARIGAGEVTASGMMIGTPSYMAPEQAAGKVREIGTASDVWALGCILYRLVTGRLPFEADSPTATVQQVLHRDPAPPRSVVADVPRDVETICLKCLEKEPGKRYPTADALAADLRAFLAGRPITARPVGAAERAWKWAKRHPARATTGGIGVLIAVAVWVTVVQVRQAIQGERDRAGREARADADVRALATAEPAVVPVLVDRLAEVRDLAGPRLRQMAGEPIHTRPGLYARLALLPDEPHRHRELLDHAAACRPAELPLLARFLAPFAAAAVPALWDSLAASRGDPDRVRRAAILLAAWDPTNPLWRTHAPTVAGQVVRVNPLEVDVYARGLLPVRAALVPELRGQYMTARGRIEADSLLRADLLDESNRFELTAGLLAAWTADRPGDLAEVLVTVVDRHYPLFAGAAVANRAAVAPLLAAEFARRPLPDLKAVGGGDPPVEPAVAAAVGVALERVSAVSDKAVEAVARRQGYAAAALFALGDPEAAWPLLAHTPDPTARSYLVARLPAVGADPVALARRYGVESDGSVRRALLTVLGDFPPDALPPAVRDPLTAGLLAEYAAHPDAGLHSTLGWVLRRWGKAEEVAAADARFRAEAERRADAARLLREERGGTRIGPALAHPLPADLTAGWFVNTEGQTFAVVRGPVPVFRGSPVSEVERIGEREPARRGWVGHTFAVAAREVSLTEFRRFRPAHPDNPFNKDPDCPAVTVSWYLAAEYCNWLSERDGIPEDQWCYAPNARGEYALGMTIRADRLALRGYRLPTEDEWEYACRAGSRTARFYGRGHALLGRYAWFEKNTVRKARPGGGLRPNDLGVFDALGNVWEWCEDSAVLDEPGRQVADYLGTTADHRRVYRGGSFFDDFGSLRAANRNSFRPGDGYYSVGIRPVRSLAE
jgi:formylglycine-generating enzyme required for sulfatase activity